MKSGKEQVEKSNTKWYLGISIVIAMALLTLLLFKLQSPTGLVVQNEAYQQDIDIAFSEYATHQVTFVDSPRLIKLSGSITKKPKGYVKIFIEANNERTVIVDSTLLDDGNSKSIRFIDVCEESCSLARMPPYAQLIIEVQDASVTLDNLKYQLAEDNNNAPSYDGPSEFNIQSGDTFTISFPAYWSDADNDDITYLLTAPEDVNMDLTEDTATIYTTQKTQKLLPITFIASDGIDVVRKNVLLRIDKAVETTKAFKTSVDLTLNGQQDGGRTKIKKTVVRTGVFDIDLEEPGIIHEEVNKVQLRGLRSTNDTLNTRIDYVADKRIGSAIFAVEDVTVDEAVITLEKTRDDPNPVVLMCEGYEMDTGHCPGWKQTDFPLTDNGDTYTFTVPHFTAFAVGTGVNLTIFDSGDVEAGSNLLPVGVGITFYANFTNSSGGPANTTTGACNVSFNHTGSFEPSTDMTYNASSQMHEYTRYFNNSGGFAFNATCTTAGETISAVDTFNVSLICGSILRTSTSLVENLSIRENALQCLTLASNNTNLNCQGFSLLGNNSGGTVGIQVDSTVAPLGNTTVQHCNLENWTTGFGPSGSNGFSIRNSLLTNNTVKNSNIGIQMQFINSILQNSTFINAGNAIDADDANNNITLRYNLFENGTNGMSTDNSLAGVIYNNTFRNNSRGLFMSNTANYLIYHNNFSNSRTAHARDLNGNNNWNTSIGGVGQGNFWDDVITLDILDANNDGWGDSGTQYAYNETNGGFVNFSVNDLAPKTILCGDTISTNNIVGTLPTGLSSINANACLTITGQNVTLDCNSFSINDSSTGVGIKILDTSSVTVRHCVISTFNIGIHADNVTSFTSLNNTLQNHTYAGIAVTRSNTDSLITQSTIENNPGNGIYLYNEARDTISHNIIRNNSNGTFISISQNITLLNNSIYNNTKAAVVNNASDNTNITSNTILQNGRSSNPPSQVYIEGSQKGVVIKHNTIERSWNGSGISSDIALPRQGTNFTIENNTLLHNALGGIIIDVENSTFSQNRITGSGTIVSSTGFGSVGNNNMISSNTISNTSIDGMSVRENNNTIINNNVTNSSRYGVYLRGDSNIISGNRITQNGETGLLMTNVNDGDSSIANSITSNIITNNTFGVVLTNIVLTSGGVTGSTFSSNTVANNTNTQINITDSDIQNNTFTSNTISGVNSSVGVNISAGSGNLFALNVFSGSYVLADDLTALGTNSWNDSTTGHSGGGNNWGDITSLAIYDNSGDGYGEDGGDLPFNRTTSASLTNMVRGSVSDNRPVTSRSSTPGGCIGCGGGGGPDPRTKPPQPPTKPLSRPPGSFDPPTPEPPTVEVPQRTPDEQIACLRVNGSILDQFISSEIALPQGVQLPKGFAIVKGPFQLACAGKHLDVTFSLPDNYENLKMMRCIGEVCYEVSGNTDFLQMQCGDETTYEQVTKSLSKRDKEVFVKDSVPLFEDEEEQSIESDKETIITHGTTKIALTGWTPLGMKLLLGLPNDVVLEPANPSLKIVGIPKRILLEKAVDGAIPAKIRYLYVDQEGIDEESIRLFYYKENGWHVLDTAIDTNTNVLEVEVPDLNVLAENKKIVLAPIGVKCTACKESVFKKEYSYEHIKFKQIYNYGGGKDAYIFVHGLMSSSSTFEYIINDFKYNKQPGQIWTLEYSTSRPLEDISQDFIDEVEQHLDEYDNIHLIGHSLGSFVVQRGLEKAKDIQEQDSLQYRFLDKVKKVILVAAPNEGSPGIEVYKNLFKNLVNEGSGLKLFNIDGEVLQRLSEGLNASRLDHAEYYVMAGSESYEFNLGLFEVKTAELLQLQGKNDGITTLRGAQKVGGEYINNSCMDFYEIDVTHTELVTNPLAIRVLERILTKEIAKELPDEPVLGYNQYFHVQIPQCRADEYYMIIGEPLDEDATYDPLLCNCGNGVCGVGEDALNCPIDCGAPSALPGICLIMPVTVNLLAILVILLFAAYLIKKYLIEYHKLIAGKKLEYMTYALLFLLALATFWTRFVCKKSVTYAYLMLVVGILYILFVELWDQQPATKREWNRDKKVDKELKELRSALHRKTVFAPRTPKKKKVKKRKVVSDRLSTIDKMLSQRRKEEEQDFIRGWFKKPKKEKKERHPELENINRELRKSKKK